MGDHKDNVKVAIRIRPLNDKERQEGGKPGITIQEPFKSIAIDMKSERKCFKFDYIAAEDVSQSDIFDMIGEPIASSCLSGYNGTIFAYGQTGAGKTFTILGHQLENVETMSPDYSNRGLLPRCFEYLFNSIQEETLQSDTKYLIKCSYLEIYQEQVNDLLSLNPQSLQLREDMRRGVYVDGLIEETVSSVSETYNILKIGTQNRHVACTSMNKESSRSHSVFTLVIESKECREGITNFRTSRFHLIDLAGSERQRATDCAGERLKEAGMINKSLSALGNVINSLVDINEGKSRHVHYRDSKLTFLLKDSLGGNSKTYIVANISPCITVIGETLSTLKFAQRAKQIKNTAVVNEDTSGAVSMLRYEVKRLKDELSIAREQTTCTRCSKMLTCTSGSEDFVEILEKTLRLKQEDSHNFSRQLADKENYIEGLRGTIARLDNKISHDKMILKFRDATIAGLQSGSCDEAREVGDLKKELEVMKEQVETNPQAARLFVENGRLVKELEEVRREVKSESVGARNSELEEVNLRLAEALNSAVQEKQEFCDRLEKVTEKYKGMKMSKLELLSTIDKLQEKVSDLEIMNCTLQTESQLLNYEGNLKGSPCSSMDDLTLSERGGFSDRKIDEILQNVNEQQEKLQTEYLGKIKYEMIIQELQEKIKDLEDKLREFSVRSDTCNTGMDGYEKEVAKMAEDISFLELQYQRKEKEVKVDKQEIQELLRDNIELRAELRETEDMFTSNEERIESLVQEIQNYERENIELKKRAGEADDIIEGKNEDFDRLRQELKQNLRNNLELTEKLQETEDQLQNSTERCACLEQELKDNLKTIEKSQTDLRNLEFLKDRCKNLEKQLEDQKEISIDLITDKDKLTALNETLQEAHKSLEQEVFNLTELTEDLKSELSACRDSEQNAAEKADYYHEEYLKLSQDLDDTTAANDELTTRLKIEKDKTEVLEEALESFKLDFAKTKLDLETKYLESVQESKHLEQELSKEKKTNSSRTDLENRVRQLSEDLYIAKSSADSFQELNLDLTQKNAELSSSLSKLHCSSVPLYVAEQLRSQVSEAHLEISVLKEENRQKIEILKSTKCQISSTKTEITAWKKCIDEKNNIINELREEVAKMQEEDSHGDEITEIKYLRNALAMKDRELKELKEKGQEYYSQADEVLENMRKKCMGLQNEVSNLRDELKNAPNSSGYAEARRHKSALRENLDHINRSNTRNNEGITAVKSMNHKLTDELKKNVEIIEILQKKNIDMNKRLSELSLYKSQYEEEIGNLTEGLTKITDFVFNLPSVKFKPEEDSIIESTIRAIAFLYETCKERRHIKHCN